MNEKLLLLRKILSQKNQESLNIEVIRSLLKDENDVNQVDENGMCLLHLAVLSGYENTASLLIDKGANVNIQDNNGQIPLHFAASEGHENIVTLLINNGAQINFKNNSGLTPLHLAALKGHEPIAHLLINKDAHINIQNNNNLTPMHLAVLNRKYEIAHLIITEGLKKRPFEMKPNFRESLISGPLTPLGSMQNRDHSYIKS